MSSESDVEMAVVPEKKPKAPPKKKPPPLEVVIEKDAKKLTTKQMIFEALTELKSRKGTSLYAIKKYIVLNYNVDLAKINYLIKKNLKASVEEGVIVQTKGAGASGSFKLVPGKDKPVKKKKNMSEKKEKTEKTEKPGKSKPDKVKPEKTAKVKKVTEKEDEKPKKALKIPKNAEKVEKENGKKKEKSSKVAKGVPRTPSKKHASMMKRKSIGSIIKAPKMKPQGKKMT